MVTARTTTVTARPVGIAPVVTVTMPCGWVVAPSPALRPRAPTLRAGRCCSRFDWGAEAASFDQPPVVEAVSEPADGRAELLEGVEALDPEDLLFQGLDGLLGVEVTFSKAAAAPYSASRS